MYKAWLHFYSGALGPNSDYIILCKLVHGRCCHTHRMHYLQQWCYFMQSCSFCLLDPAFKHLWQGWLCSQWHS